jgi:hypothetical protein
MEIINLGILRFLESGLGAVAQQHCLADLAGCGMTDPWLLYKDSGKGNTSAASTTVTQHPMVRAVAICKGYGADREICQFPSEISLISGVNVEIGKTAAGLIVVAGQSLPETTEGLPKSPSWPQRSGVAPSGLKTRHRCLPG